MAKSNETRLQETETKTKLPNNQQDMNQMYYRPNEANFNYKGITFNVDIPMFIEQIKKLIDNGQKKKALRELKKLENKTMTDVQHHNSDVFEEIIDEIDED